MLVVLANNERRLPVKSWRGNSHRSRGCPPGSVSEVCVVLYLRCHPGEYHKESNNPTTDINHPLAEMDPFSAEGGKYEAMPQGMYFLGLTRYRATEYPQCLSPRPIPRSNRL